MTDCFEFNELNMTQLALDKVNEKSGSESFPTSYSDILHRLDNLQPQLYGKTRNYIDGAVTRLSPYISRGVISTRMVMEKVLKKGLPFHQIEKLIQELAWRDYWQQVWISKGKLIDKDLKQSQEGVENLKMPLSILKGSTGISSIDKAIEDLRQASELVPDADQILEELAEVVYLSGDARESARLFDKALRLRMQKEG